MRVQHIGILPGFSISTLARNQLQAMQASVFLLLPSIAGADRTQEADAALDVHPELAQQLNEARVAEARMADLNHAQVAARTAEKLVEEILTPEALVDKEPLMAVPR